MIDGEGRRTGPALEAPRTRPVVGMRLIVSGVTAGLVALAMVTLGLLALHSSRDLLTREIQNRLLLEARNLANLGADALLDEFPELVLTPLIREMRSRRPELAVAVVLDRDGNVRGSDDPRALNRPWSVPAATDSVSAGVALAPGERFRRDAGVLYAEVPIQRTGGHLLGRAVVGLRRDYLAGLLAQTRRKLLLLSALLLALGLVVAVLVMRFLLRPVQDLREGLDRIGRGDLETPMAVRDRTELGLLAETVNSMAARIRASQAAMLEKERLAHEMTLAHRIQQSLMPDHDLAAGPYAIAGSYQAAAEVGGDYYDVFSLPGDRVGILLADVAGKGLAGCLVTSMLAVLVRSLREARDTPSDLLRALERALVDSLEPGVFVTLFYGILEPATDTLTFASAAHNPLLVYRRRDGRVEHHLTRGLPLGAIRGPAFAASLHDETVHLEPGDVVLQYTDGINEAPRAADQEEFGMDRLAALLAESAHLPPGELLARIQATVGRWQGSGQMDDQTLVAISRSRQPVACPDRTARVLHWMRNHTAEDIEAGLGRAHHLAIPSRLADVQRVEAWLRGLPAVAALGEEEQGVLVQAVYELCANIAEHGYPGRDDGTIELWWQPTGEMPLDGHLLLRDEGLRFDLGAWPSPDLSDPVVRARGRGLGILMLKSLLDETKYLPNTGLGNLNLLRYDPLLAVAPEETTV